MWKCLCDCGNTTTVSSDKITSGWTSSCGCFRIQRVRETTSTHGLTGTRAYRIWNAMKTRCNNPNTQYYYNYGGRGIKVCERWNLFENFLLDMGDPPTDKHSIDRIDNDKDYEPSNCRWATATEQANNRRRRKPLDVSNRLRGEKGKFK